MNLSVFTRGLIILSSIMAGLLCFAEEAQAAYQPGALVSPQPVANFAAITAGHWGPAYTTLKVAGALANADGGDGTFTYSSTPCTPDNGGTCIRDVDGNSYTRDNVNNDLRHFGIVNNSVYDAVAHPTTVTSASSLIATAFTNLAAKGIYSVHTNRVNFLIGTTLTIPPLSSLDCDVPAGGPISNGYYAGIPGTIITAHGASVTSESNSASINHCIGTPQWLVDPTHVSDFSGFTFSYPASTPQDLEAIRGNINLAGDTFLYLNGNGSRNVVGAKSEYLWIYGYDNAINGTNPTTTNIQNVWADANIGIYYNGGGGQSDIQNIDVEPFLTRQVKAGGTGSNIHAEQYWQISTIAPSPTANSFGTHLCRLTVTDALADSKSGAPFDYAYLSTSSTLDAQSDPVNYPVWITGLTSATGGQGCRGRGPYGIVAISHTGSQAIVDLVGSEYGTGSDKLQLTAQWSITPVSGITPNPYLILVSSGDVRNIQAGMTVADNGTHGIPSGAKIKQVMPYFKGDDPRGGYIGAFLIDKPITLGVSADTAITLDGGAFTASDQCNGGAAGQCLFLSQPERRFAGNSLAAQAVAQMDPSRGRHFGAAYVANNTPGFRAINVFEFAHHYPVITTDSNNCVFTALHNDGNKELDDIDLLDMAALGVHENACMAMANGLGNGGAGYLADFPALSDSTGNLTTMSGTVSTAVGVTVTTVGDISGWPAFGAGVHLTVGMCQTYDGVNHVCTSPEEYASGVYQAGIHSIKLVARGIYNTAPASYTAGATIFYVSVSPQDSWLALSNMGSSLTDQTLTNLDIEHGVIIADGLRTSATQTFGWVSHNALGLNLGNASATGMNIVAEDSQAYGVIRGAGNKCSAACPNPSYPYQGNGVAQAANGWTALGQYGTTYSTGQTVNPSGVGTAGWPQGGAIAKVDNEYFWYVIDATNSMVLDVTQRGACGSTPASHTDGATITYYNFLPCPWSGSPLLAVGSDNTDLTLKIGQAESTNPATTTIPLSTYAERMLSVSDYGAVGDGSTDDSPAFAAAFAAAQANKINTVYVTKNLKYYLASGLSVPTGYKLQCLNAYAGQLTNGATTPTGDHKNYPYTLLIPSASTVTLSNGGPNGEIDGCTIENKAVYDTPNPTDWPSWRVTAAAFGGTGVTAGGDGAAIRNSLIVGFNQCYLASGYDTTQVVNVIGDCTASFKLVNSQFFSGQWTNVHADPVLSDRTTWNQITLAIATISDSASTPGIYRVTLASPCSVANCPRTGDPAYVGLNNSSTGLPTGAESAAGGNGAGDGSWTITKIDNSNYDLVGSKSTATVTTGTTVTGSNQVCGVGDLVSNNVASHIRAPQAVTGTGIPGGTTLVTLDPYMGCVWLSAAATASGAIANLTFTDNAYVAGANPYYLRLFASVRTGAGFEINNTLDGKFFGLHAYDHRTAMLWNNTSRSNTFHGFVDEYENLLMDPLSIGLDIEDATGGNSMDGGAIGQSSGIGTAVLNRQTVTSAKAANKITNVNIGGTDFVGTAGEPAYLYNESGNLTLVAADAGPGDNGNMFVADNIRFFNAVVGDNNLTVPYFQSETAAGRSCILGGSLAVGTYASLCPQTVTQTITANVGGGQAGATQLTSVINSVVNCASDHCGVALPPAVAGSVIYVINRSSKILDVYANYGTSDIINGGATTDVVSLPARTIIGTIPSIAAFMVTTNANWRTTPSYNGATLNGTLCQFSVACVFGQGPVYNATGTLQTGYHSVVGSYTLVAGTVTITLTGSAIFGGTTNYQCFANDNGAAVAAASTQNVSASSFKVFGTLTDTGIYFCTGN